MKLHKSNIGGEVIKDTEQYKLTDNRTSLDRLVLSKTHLHEGQSTNGHAHPGVEEIYFFTLGMGEMQVGEEKFVITNGTIVTVPDGVFHRVFASRNTELIFLCVFETYERDK